MSFNYLQSHESVLPHQISENSMISNNACITYQPLAVVSDSAAIELILNVSKVANITVRVIIIFTH